MREENGHLRGYLGKPMRVFIFFRGCWFLTRFVRRYYGTVTYSALDVVA